MKLVVIEHASSIETPRACVCYLASMLVLIVTSDDLYIEFWGYLLLLLVFSGYCRAIVVILSSNTSHPKFLGMCLHQILLLLLTLESTTASTASGIASQLRR